MNTRHHPRFSRFIILTKGRLPPEPGWVQLEAIVASFQGEMEGINHTHMGECLLLLYGAMFLEMQLEEFMDLWSRALSIGGSKHPNPGLVLKGIISAFVDDPKRFGAAVLPPALRDAIVPTLHEFLKNCPDHELPTLCKYMVLLLGHSDEGRHH